MLKVAFICFKYPPAYSGYGHQAYNVFQEIQRQNKKLFFYVLTWNIGKANNTTENSRVYRLGSAVFTCSNYLKSIIFGFLVFLWLVSNRKKYMVIHCLTSGAPAVFAIIAGKLIGKKSLIKITKSEMKRNSSANPVMSILRKARQKFTLYADFVIAISLEICNDLLKLKISDGKILKIPNGVDRNLFSPPKSLDEKYKIRDKLKFEKEQVVLLYTGMINKRKGINILIEAVRKPDYKVPVLLVLCGPTYGHFKRLKEDIDLINKNNYKLKFRYDGVVENVNEYLSASDIFILPSHSEGLSNSLLEAAMSGLPLIASNIGGNREIVAHNFNGLLFDAGEIDQLAAAIDILVHDQEKCMKFGKASSEMAIKHYSMEKVASQYIDLYLSLQRKMKIKT